MTSQDQNRPPESPNPMPASDQPGSPGAAPQTSEELQAQQNQTQAQERAQVAASEQRGEPAAERPTEETSIFGMRLNAGREIAGGGNIIEHSLDTTPNDPTVRAAYYHRRYIGSRLRKEAGDIIARSPENIGFWGKGDTYRGNGGILVDVDTMEKHRFPDGFRFDTDAVYANSRDLPPALVDGDLGQNLSGEAAQTMADNPRATTLVR